MKTLVQAAISLILVGLLVVVAPAGAAVNIQFVYSPLVSSAGQPIELSLLMTDSSSMKLIRHSDINISVFKGDQLIFGTGHTHTHSGLYSWTIMMPTAGEYKVRATFFGSASDRSGRYNETSHDFPLVVKGAGKLVPAGVEIKLPAMVSLNKPSKIELRVWERNSKSLLPHVEAMITLLQGNRQIYSGVIHAHSGLVNFSYLFTDKGEYRLIAQFSPTKGFAPLEFAPVVGEKIFKVE